MGYLKFMKADGSADLLPADDLFHVSAPKASSADINITLGGNAPKVYAVIKGANSANADADLTAASRNGINAAIEKANGASGPAIVVDLGEGLFCKEIEITDSPAT